MAKLFFSGALHQLAREMSPELAPHRLSKETHRRLLAPFLAGARSAISGLEGSQREAAVEAMANARRQQMQGWLLARADIFRRAGFDSEIRGVDELYLRCRSCNCERILVAGIVPSNSELACPACSPKS